MAVAGFSRRPHDYQNAAPRVAIPGNGVNLSLLITPTRIPLGVRMRAAHDRRSARGCTAHAAGGGFSRQRRRLDGW
jgi:hypothetical protein